MKKLGISFEETTYIDSNKQIQQTELKPYLGKYTMFRNVGEFLTCSGNGKKDLNEWVKKNGDTCHTVSLNLQI